MDFDRFIEILVNMTTIICIMWLSKGVVMGVVYLYRSLSLNG